MTEPGQEARMPWNVLVVEDDGEIRRQIKEFLSGQEFADRQITIREIGNLEEALDVVRERKADILILDVYRGEARRGGERTGIAILERIRESGFAPVILYTALPEGLEGYVNSFVRLVSKEAGGLEGLRNEMEALFSLRVPQIHRAIVNHLDRTLATYMWGFVLGNWTEFEPLIRQEEFVRLVLQRLATAFSRERVQELTAEVSGAEGRVPDDPEKVHPAECYVKPPVGPDPVLGDLRTRRLGKREDFIVVLWPSCDMVSSGGRTPKVGAVLCARAGRLDEAVEVGEWLKEPGSSKKRKAVSNIITNRRKGPSITEERYHFLPGVWDIPSLIIDFQALEFIDLNELRELQCLATIASPFAEALASRFWRYLGRIGTPDLNADLILERVALVENQK